MESKGYVYFLKGNMKCNGVAFYYTGATLNISKRLEEHRNATKGFTSKLENIVLIGYITVPEANRYSIEYYLKHHRNIIYAFVGKKMKGNPEKLKKKFKGYCDELGISFKYHKVI